MERKTSDRWLYRAFTASLVGVAIVVIAAATAEPTPLEVILGLLLLITAGSLTRVAGALDDEEDAAEEAEMAAKAEALAKFKAQTEAMAARRSAEFKRYCQMIKEGLIR